MLPGPVICLHSCKYIKAKSSPSPSPLSWLASFWIWFFLLLLFLVMFLSNLQLLLQISLSLCSISTELKKIITSPSTVYLVSGFVCLFFHWCSLSLYTQEINHALADIAVSSLFPFNLFCLSCSYILLKTMLSLCVSSVQKPEAWSWISSKCIANV